MAIQTVSLQLSSPYKLQPSFQSNSNFTSSLSSILSTLKKHNITNFSISSSLHFHSNSINSCKLNFNEATSLPLKNEIPPNALRRKQDPLWRGGFSLGVDLGLSHTGLALSKGFSFRPLTVLSLRGQKLELRIIDIAEKEEVDEFIIGLPKSSDGNETPQSNKVRSVAGRLAIRAAERGWRVYLQDEYGTSVEAMNRMINTGFNKSARHGKIDAYAATMLLERYYSKCGEETELLWPKNLELQEKIRKGPSDDDDDFFL
ncbi:putative pre-16S rRNA nuclease [Bienertia sinuspersici]